MKIGVVVPIRLKTPQEKLVLERVGGERIVDMTLRRLRRVRGIGPIVLAVAGGEEAGLLRETVSACDATLRTGPEEPLARIIAAARDARIDVVVKCNGNAPFLDPALTEALIDRHLEEGNGYTFPVGFPRGVLPDLINLETLVKIDRIGSGGRYYHIARQYPERYHVGSMTHDIDLETLRLEIFSALDLKLAAEIYGSENIFDIGFAEVIERLPATLADLTECAETAKERKTFNEMLNNMEYAIGVENMRSLPPLLLMDTHNLCNIRCKTCPQQFEGFSEKEYDATFITPHVRDLSYIPIFSRRKDGRYIKKSIPMQADTFKKIEDELIPFARSVSFGYYAESLLNKKFFEMLTTCTEAGLAINFLTNGSLLTEKVVRRIVELEVDAIGISFDGATKATYEEIRRDADFDGVVASIEYLTRLRDASGNGRPHTRMAFTGSRENICELPDLVALAARIGVNSVQVAHRFILDYMDPRDSLFHYPELTKEQIEEARRVGAERGVAVTLSPRLAFFVGETITGEKCGQPWRSTYLSSTGDVHLCNCGILESAGNIATSSFRDIWNREAFKALRRSFGKEAPSRSECLACGFEFYISGGDPRRAFFSDVHLADRL